MLNKKYFKFCHWVEKNWQKSRLFIHSQKFWNYESNEWMNEWFIYLYLNVWEFETKFKKKISKLIKVKKVKKVWILIRISA
jgi:hypothetical protein